ncbi:hypothetical protein [Komagataeibacter sucrofermentans]|nr:hypothetical protein AA15973_1046 [Komagataeibacter sucrofermentans DSM 15973]
MLPDGTIRATSIRIFAKEGAGLIELPLPDGTLRRYEAVDIWTAFRAMWNEMEHGGVRLLCAGARRDATISGMARSMCGGRKAYIVHKGQAARVADLVDIFDHAEPMQVGTARQQRDFIRDWHKSFRTD